MTDLVVSAAVPGSSAAACQVPCTSAATHGRTFSSLTYLPTITQLPAEGHETAAGSGARPPKQCRERR